MAERYRWIGRKPLVRVRTALETPVPPQQAGPITGITLVSSDPSGTQGPVIVGVESGTREPRFGTLKSASGTEDDENDTLCAELGIPPGVPLYRLLLEAPFGWQDYSMYLVGTVATLADPPDAPRFVDGVFFDDDGPLPMIARCRRVYCAKTPLYLEARWHPAHGESIDLRGVKEDLNLKGVAKVRLGIKLLQQTVTRRQEKPEGFDSYADAIAAIVDAVAILKKKGAPHHEQDVAEYLMKHNDRFHRRGPLPSTDRAHKARTLRHWCQRAGLVWDDIERLADNSLEKS